MSSSSTMRRLARFNHHAASPLLTTTAAAPLAGVRVLDLTRILAGPFCTQALGDQGADVIKVEAPGGGDDTRRWGPPFWGDLSAYFIACNRNKRSVAIDLKSAQGRAAVLDLVRISDVLVENFLPGKLDAMGLGYAELAAMNPRLVYASISGYGATGPQRTRAGYDVAAAAEGGLMSITGQPDGPPCKAGVALVRGRPWHGSCVLGGGAYRCGAPSLPLLVAQTDITTGLFMQSAILAALFAVQRTGRGQRLDASLLDCCVAGLANVASNVLVADWPARRWGTAHESIVPYQAFETGDAQHVVVAAMNDRQFASLCEVLGRADLSAPHGPYATNPQRVEGRAALVAELQAAFLRGSRTHWLTVLQGAGLTAAPINSVREALDHPQVRARGLITSVTARRTAAGPDSASLPLVGPPVHYGGAPLAVVRPPPRLGEHTREVLRDVLGWAPADIDAALASGAAADAAAGPAPAAAPPPP